MAGMTRLLGELRLIWYSRYRQPMLAAAGLCLLLGSAAAAVTLMIGARQQAREIHCLALNIYHEARGEPDPGKLAVATVTLNRVRSAEFPDSICEVVYQRHWIETQGRWVSAFSWTTESVDLLPEAGVWQRILDVATRSYQGEGDPELGEALFYHATHVRPAWAKARQRIKRIGRHVFYR